MKLNGYNFIDIFCHLGGATIVLSEYGAKCVFASELSRRYKFFYEYNTGMAPAHDIRRIKPDQIAPHQIVALRLDEQLFIDGNVTGRNKYRQSTMEHIIKIIDYHRPEVVIFTHEKYSISDAIKSSVKEHYEPLKFLFDHLSDLNYFIRYKELNGWDYGSCLRSIKFTGIAFKDIKAYGRFKFPKKLKKRGLESFLDYDIEECPPSKFKMQFTAPLKKGVSPVGKRVTWDGLNKSYFLVNGMCRQVTKRERARMLGYPEDYKINSVHYEMGKKRTEVAYVLGMYRAVVRETARVITCPY